ncbi:MAG: NAD(+)/NADH kinase [Succinivibrio sp.]|nr:NAD(+)/NADH kinase [Succinivibrio sp.]
MLSTALTPKVITSAVIVSRVFGRPVSGTILEIARILTRLGVEVFLDENTAVGFNLTELKTISRHEMKQLDLIIVVGGDGSLLGAARTLVDLKVPMLGVNGGHLGLLTDVSPQDLEQNLEKVVNARYQYETRTVLDVRVTRRDEDGAGELIGQSLATNETVIHSGMMAHMMTFRVSIDRRYMYTLRGDGIIVNTPTGSTAYSLSAGGSIIEPHLDVLALVPMFPQSLNCSPIIIPGKSEVHIDFDWEDRPEVEIVSINCDGQVTIRADNHCAVSIKQHKVPLILIHPEGYDYYSLLRQKLGWGQSLV